jgi:TolB-like protein/Tfp pilus assembly protein PilF
VADLRERLQSGLADRYRLERELGRGGMATVFLAQDLRHDRPVALKVLHSELAATLGPERFQREIKLAAGLQHPHILTVHDSGETAGQLWYTMPYVAGESLRDRLRRERQLPLDDALQITREVADALGYAHSQGIVHRDIKPDNILLSHGHALVADFGVARALQNAGGEQLTQTGSSVGTPAYMSPEQSMADPSVDARSDLYSLGCVLYEMLTGEAPYTGPSTQAIIAKRLLDPVPSARRLRETVPAGVDQALQRVLAKTPADRFGTAAAFVQALRTGSQEVSPAAGQPGRGRPMRPHGRAVVLTGFGVVVLVVLGSIQWLRSHGRGPVATAEAGSPKRLAVIPFENLGDSADAYFADGLTDAVRDKLTAVPDLEVIASTSSRQYSHTAKASKQIGKELGVRYLLLGKVRWAKGASRPTRVQVRPELIDAASGAERWGEPFDAALTDVFEVQADIAGRVAEALGVALGADERRALAERPTQNLPAYNAYLQALEARRTDAPTAVAGLERAVALDSMFALAWAQLALTRQYFSSAGFTPREQIEHSKADAERALALQPKLPIAYFALGQYFKLLGDYDRALAEYARGLEVAPNDVGLLSGIAEVDMRRGQLARALEVGRRLTLLDPLSTYASFVSVVALQYLHRFPEALVVVNQALARDSLNLDRYLWKIEILAATDDLAGARQTLENAERRVGFSQAVAYLGRYYAIQWTFPDMARAFLLRLSPSAMEGDTLDWALSLAYAASSLRGRARTRVLADTARRILERRIALNPSDHSLVNAACQAEALAGRAGEARRYCAALREHPDSDALNDSDRWAYARAALEIGDTDGAVDALEQSIRVPSRFTRAWFRLDPNFAPLRGNPRFERLVNGT